jgi:hypothetical protein
MTSLKQELIAEIEQLDDGLTSDVLGFVRSLRQKSEDTSGIPLADLMQSGLVGMWAERTDMDDPLSFAHELRRRASRRTRP